MGWAIAQKKAFFHGKRAIQIINERSLSRQLVGFTIANTSPLPQECNLVIKDNVITGRVTSVSRSPTLKKIIGLAFVSPDKSEAGQKIQIKLSNSKLVEAQVCQTPFYDPDNKRQEM